MAAIKTVIDQLCLILAEKPEKEASVAELAKQLNVPAHDLRPILAHLEEQGVCGVTKGPSAIGGERVTLKRVLRPAPPELPKKGKIAESYKISIHEVDAEVRIIDLPDSPVLTYFLSDPYVYPYTEIYLESLRDELARTIPLSTIEILDRRQADEVMARFFAAAEKKLAKIPSLGDGERKTLAGVLLHNMYGLGKIEMLIADDNLEEIAINGAATPLVVFHKRQGWLSTNIKVESEDEIFNYASQIGRKSSRDITLLQPILDTHLQTGDRVSSTMFPISTCGNTLTIRKFARQPWTMVDFIEPKLNTFSLEIGALLWQCVQYEMNVLVTGGTASGKTSLLNTLAALIPPQDRIISIEDTRELALPHYLEWNWVPLTTRNANIEGKGGVSTLDLMTSALRMRPDRILLGEVRTRQEAETLFEAVHTGHAVYTTMHADTARQVVRRMTHPPFELPVADLQSLHIIVVQYRDRRKGIRRTYEISEVLTSSADVLSLNTLFRWRPRKDEFEKVNESLRLLEELNLHTGMSAKELKDDLDAKALVLSWMSERGIHRVDDVGEAVGAYYKEPERIIDAAKKDLPPQKVFPR